MKINIWGSRGSIARSHPDLVRYGGNTSCVEIESETTRIVLDLGSGAYDLGQKLVKKGPMVDQHVLLSHTHWDHIQGSEWNIHAPGGFSSSLKEKLASQMSHEFFPISLEVMGANINYLDLKEGELELGAFHVQTQYINHTVLTLGYRLEADDGTSMAYITDHEPYDHRLATEGYKPPAKGAPLRPDDRHADFFRGVDFLIHDTQYTAKNYTEHYGHSTVEYVVDMAMAVGVKTLALFHHDPNRKDSEVDEILAMARERVQKAGGTLNVIAAADNTSHDLVGNPEFATRRSISLTKPRVLKESNRRESALTKVSTSNHEIVVCHSDQEKFAELKNDGLGVSHIKKGHPFLRVVKEKKPALILVGYETSGDEFVFKNCKRIRENFGSFGLEIPYIVVVKDQHLLDDVKQAHGEDYGVTDYICEPFSESYIRTRIRMALTRTPCKWVPPLKPKTEQGRMEALWSLHILDSSPEERFDRITRMCAAVFDVPLVFISMIDENRQWFKSTRWLCSGSAPTETSREVSFCGHAILGSDIFTISDATQDERFADNPLVVGGPKIRFYAGCPISVPNINDPTEGEHNVGSLCIIDQRPRDINDMQKSLLREFAAMVKMEMMNFAQSINQDAGARPQVPSAFKANISSHFNSSEALLTKSMTIGRAA